MNDQKMILAQALLDGETPSWGEPQRQAARERFLKLGAPMRRDEYWRYTDPAKFNQPLAPIEAAVVDPEVGDSGFGDAEALTLVFVNGRLRPDLSDAIDIPGLEVTRLADGIDGSWAAEKLGALEVAGQEPVARPYAALNAALAVDGLAIRVTGDVPKPIHFRYLAEGSDRAVYVRHVIDLAPEAALTVLESGAGGERFNAVIEVDIGDKATFRRKRLQNEAGADQVITHLFARLGEESALRSFTLTGVAGASKLVRNEAMIWLEGDEGSAHIAGGVMGDAKAHLDNTVFIVHDALNCQSRQVFKNVLADEARGVFQGKILVKEGAQKTDGYQISQSVLLGERAEFDVKPELEIYADDVACSHGSTSGALDETAMFYLRSRGVSQAVAERLLVEAFIEEAIQEIDEEGPQAEALREAMRGHVAAWMSDRTT
ncbi:MAG: SufD family Fe-S cluster assembly protein [Pseudomonadota bacterium]